MCLIVMFTIFCQAVVQHVNVEGYWKTKKDILVPSIKGVLEATNFREVIKSDLLCLCGCLFLQNTKH